MKKIITAITALVCLFLTVSLASCGNVDEKVNEATSPLNDKISRLEAEIFDLEDEITGLNGQIEKLENENEAFEEREGELEAEKATLETEKAELESEKEALKAEKTELEAELAAKQTELECTKGLHIWNGEGEVSYTWAANYSDCKASFVCKKCDESVTVKTEDITADKEAKEIVASFGDAAPSTSASVIYFTSASFNSDSEGYNEAEGTFYVTNGEPLVFTFDGINFDQITAEKNYIIGICSDNRWLSLDYVFGSVYGITEVTENQITITLDQHLVKGMIIQYDEVIGFALFSSETSEMAFNTQVMITPRVKESTDEPTTDSEGYTLVSTAEELEKAASSGGKIRLCADIVSNTGFDLLSDSVVDLAGYSISVTDDTLSSFWVHESCVILDSVGGSRIYNDITVNGSLKLCGAIKLQALAEHISLSGNIDLSEYRGDDLYFYVYSNATGIILPDGYAMYSASLTLIPDLNAAKEVGYVYVMPIQSSAPSESIGFPEFTLPTEGKVNFADYNIPMDEILAFLPERLEIKYENGIVTVNDMGFTNVSVFDYATFVRTDLSFVDGVWSGEAELDSSKGLGVDVYGRKGENVLRAQYKDGEISDIIQVNDDQVSRVLMFYSDLTMCVMQLIDVNGFNVEFSYSDGVLEQQWVSCYSPDQTFFVSVHYDKEYNFVQAEIYDIPASKHYYYFPEGWSMNSDRYVEGGEAAPDYESYTPEDFMALCPSQLSI